jgi:hypothetical protein
MQQTPTYEVTASSRGTRFTDAQIAHLKQAVNDGFNRRFGVQLTDLGGQIVTVANTGRVVWSLPRHLSVFVTSPAVAELLVTVVAEALIEVDVDGAVSVRPVIEVHE